MHNTRIIHWPEGEPQPGDTHREYGRTWVYIPMPEGSPVPGVWKSIGGNNGSGGGGGGGGTVWWDEIYGKPESYPPQDHTHLDTEILVDVDEDGDYSDAPDLHTVLQGFRDKVDAMMDQLVFGGSFDAATGKFKSLSDVAIASGFAEGESIPSSTTPDQDRLFFISVNAGTVNGDSYDEGDWMVSSGGDWIPINYNTISSVTWDDIEGKPDTIVYDDIAYKPDLKGKPLARYIDASGNGRWIEGNTGSGGDGGTPGYHTHGFDEVIDGDGNDLNDVVANLQGDIAALQGDLIFAGTYNATQARVIQASTQGQLVGFSDGGPLPDPDAANKSHYVLVIDDGGTFAGETMSRGDWLISDGIGWVVLNYVQQDFDVPVLPGNATGRVLTWDNQSDIWSENTNFTLSDSGSIDLEGGVEAKGNITIPDGRGVFTGDGSGLYNLPGMDDFEPPVVSVDGRTGAVTLNDLYQAKGNYAASNHNHNGVYQPVGSYLTEFTETDPTVPSHVKGITTTNISNWNKAHGWGNHASAGYAKSGDIPTVSYPVTSVNGKTGAVSLNYSDVGAQVAGSYAASNHNHSGTYAPASHSHDYAASNHNHSGVYAPASHTHAYSPTNHSHSEYSLSGHTHSGYAPTSHSHNYAPNAAGNGISVASSKISMTGSFTGTFTATGDVTAYSDEALKKNIITAPCDVIDQLRGVEFEWKEGGNFGSGVIAQEVEQVLPHLIHKHEDGHKSVNYNGLLGYLIEEVKALKAEVEALRGS